MGLIMPSPLELPLPKKIAFEEYNLDNGCMLFLHHDPSVL
jgi:hypothetical protein